MPVSAPRPCTFKGCRKLVRDGSGRCPDHPREAWVRSAPVKRITGRRLQAMRAALFAREPLCQECLKHDRAVPATERDHIIPLAEGGADDETNEQALCEECHEAKSKVERARGVRKYHRGKG
ncbi:HNH endonuclease [Duganella sp. FT94W]|uniref:HNH endonuclease n=1 Tax=Duganella lactea TaxID=2692173 RepID=A0ABW9VCP6_9BURK|nr:HNH endonuclease [Duganella lactea]